MRFAERFLVAFAIIALIMRYAGMKDGPTMELIALPLLAAFYIFAMPLYFQKERRLYPMLAATGCGLALAYCIISLMLYTLRWLPRLDMIENCGLLLSIVVGSSLFLRRHGGAFAIDALIRVAVLLGVVLLAAVAPLPAS